MTTRRLKIGIPVVALLTVAVLSQFLFTYATIPTTKTGWVGTDNNGNYTYQPVTWSQPSSGGGTFNVYVNDYVGGNFVVFVYDITANTYLIDHVGFSTSRNCNTGNPYTVNLTGSHSYEMGVDIPLHHGGAANVVFADAKIFLDCGGQ